MSFEHGRLILNRTSILSFCVVCLGAATLITSTAVSQSGISKNLVALQPSTPGISQSGHGNISGTFRAGQFAGGGAGLTNVNATLLGGIPASSYLTAIPNPLSLSGSAGGTGIFLGTNSSSTTSSSGVHGVSTATSGIVSGVRASTESTLGRAVYALANATTGTTYAGFFTNASVSGYGLRANSSGTYGVAGFSTLDTGTSYGGYFSSDSLTGIGVYGQSTNTGSGAGNYGVYGLNSGFNGAGVYGESASTTGSNFGGRFRVSSSAGTGVSAAATSLTGTTYGGRFENNSTSGRGVFGWALATSGTTYGLYGRSDSATGIAVYGSATGTSGQNYGVFGETDSTTGTAVYGIANQSIGSGYGGHFESNGSSGRGVYGVSTSTTGTTYGGYFTTSSVTGRGVYGFASATTGLNYGGLFYSSSLDGDGVRGVATASGGAQNGGVFLGENTGGYGSISSGYSVGAFGQAENVGGTGVRGGSITTSNTSTSYGVRGIVSSTNAWAVYAVGDLGASGTKSFRIDHPFDPENKYLIHYSTESPSPQNFYLGNVTTDAKGRAWVELPEYFSAINTNFKYQLTVIGDDESETFVQAKVAKKIENNRFLIMTSQPNTEVSWRVDADRNDLYVRSRERKDVVEKSGQEKGTYQHPELYGVPIGKGTFAREEARVARAIAFGSTQK